MKGLSLESLSSELQSQSPGINSATSWSVTLGKALHLSELQCPQGENRVRPVTGFKDEG